MMPIAAAVMLIVAALAGGFLLGHRDSAHRCRICQRPLPRVCHGGRCGSTPGAPVGLCPTQDPSGHDGIPLTGAESPDDSWTAQVDMALALAGPRSTRAEHYEVNSDAVDLLITALDAEHYESGGWGGVPGECGAECACGAAYDGFDTLGEAIAMLREHVTAASSALAIRGAA